MSPDRLPPDWEHPTTAVNKVFEAADQALDFLDKLPKASVPETLPISADEEFQQFVGRVLLANEQRYHQIQLTGLHAAAETAGFRIYHFIRPNKVLPFSIMGLFGTDSRGNPLSADGLNVYGNPHKPGEATYSFARIEHHDQFVPIGDSQPSGYELRDLHDHLVNIRDRIKPVHKPNLRILRPHLND